VRDIGEVDEWNNEHPNEINEVPIEAHGLDVAGSEASAGVKRSDDEHGNDATDNVKQVQAGDGEKGLAKHAGADGDFAGEEFKPFADVESGKKNAEEHGGVKEAHGFGFVAGFGGIDGAEHGQAAGDKDEGHENDVDDAGGFKRADPVGSGDAEIAVGKEESTEGDRIGNDEEPDGELTRRDGIRRGLHQGFVSVHCQVRLAHRFLPRIELQLETAQQEQVKPKNADEMPVDGGVVEKAAANGRTRCDQAGSEINEGENTRKSVENMDEGKDVEERTVGIAGEIQALGAELLPGKILADTKGQAERKGEQQPRGTFAGGARLDEAAWSKGAARQFQRGAAGEKDERMEGNARWPQSVVPSRTKRALVNAAKDMVMAKMPTQMPLREARSTLETTATCPAARAF
jgi:hypothetical protein